MQQPSEGLWAFTKARKRAIFIATYPVLLVVFVLLFDLAAANIYKSLKGDSWYSRTFKPGGAERQYRVRHPVYHHDLARNYVTDRALWGDRQYSVRTNSLGFIDRSTRQVDMESSSPRILFIGDSFTEGKGLDYEDTFVGIVDESLPAVEVLNAGVSSYSPTIYWRKVKYLIEEVGLQFDEVIVYLDISDIEDESKVYRLCGDIVTQYACQFNDVREFLKDNSILLVGSFKFLQKVGVTREIKSLIGKVHIPSNDRADDKVSPQNGGISPDQPKPRGDSGDAPDEIDVERYSVNLERSLWTVDEELYEEYGKYGLEKSEKFMNKLHGLLSEKHIGLTIAVYPWPAQLYYNDKNSKQVVFWRNWADERDVDFVNHFDTFFQERQRLGVKNVLDSYYKGGDVHFNERGNRLIAQELLKHLKGRVE